MDEILDKPYFRHIIIEVQTTSKNLNSLSWLQTKAVDLLEEFGLRTLSKIEHKFSPQGISLAYILTTSHIAFHTWPESNYLHIDLLTCSKEIDNKNIGEIANKIFQTSKIVVKKLSY